MQEMKKADLIKAAEDLNEVLGLDPGIDTGEKPELLRKHIKEGALWLYETDVIKDVTVEVLKTMDWSDEDFEGLSADQNPIPALERYGIIDDDSEEVVASEEDDDSEEVEEIIPEPETKAPEPKPKPEKKEPKEYLDKDPTKVVKKQGPSAYGMALALMGPDPTITVHDLYDLMKAHGFDIQVSGGSIKTAHSIFKKVYLYLKEHGHIKEPDKKKKK